MTHAPQHFPGQRTGEHVRLLMRKHWVTDLRSALTFLLIGIFPLLIALWIGELLWQNSDSRVFWGFVMGFLVYLLFIGLITYVHWLNEELDIIVVTDQRVISHEQIDLFHRQISEAHVSQIQDVKGSERGLLQNLLHYGRLEIMTSSNDTFFHMNYVEDPYENARRLLDIRDKFVNS